MRPDNSTPGSLSAIAIAVAAVALATALLGNGLGPKALPPNMVRVQAAAVTPKPTAAPAPKVAFATGAFSRPSNECPQMNNPGGHLGWGPTKQLGPTPTGGTISLPTLGVTANVYKVGIDSQNKMVVPHNAKDVAWLDRGGIPGYTNNIVMAGHISYSRVAGSFIRIGDLRHGDEVVLKMNGHKLRYEVQWTCLFGRNTDRAEQIMGYTNEPSLTLISCGGGWDSAAGTHTGRYAVRAVQITDRSSSQDRTEAAPPAAASESTPRPLPFELRP